MRLAATVSAGAVRLTKTGCSSVRRGSKANETVCQYRAKPVKTIPTSYDSLVALPGCQSCRATLMYLFIHYNWQYDFMRPSWKEIVDAYLQCYGREPREEDLDLSDEDNEDHSDDDEVTEVPVPVQHSTPASLPISGSTSTPKSFPSASASSSSGSFPSASAGSSSDNAVANEAPPPPGGMPSTSAWAIF